MLMKEMLNLIQKYSEVVRIQKEQVQEKKKNIKYWIHCPLKLWGTDHGWIDILGVSMLIHNPVG